MIINTIDELVKIKNKSNIEITLNITDNIERICDILEDLNPTIKINNISNEISNELNKRNTFIGFNTSILNKVRQICMNVIKDGDYVVDATTGNGNDTLFLCKLVSNGKVFGFDIQDTAINNTKKILDSNNITNYVLYKESHTNIDKVLYKYKNKIKLVLFNLGYLPKGDKSIMTNHITTKEAFIKSLNMLCNDGLVLLVFYPHEEGLKEASSIKEYLNTNNIPFKEYHNTKKEYSPYLISVKKC